MNVTAENLKSELIESLKAANADDFSAAQWASAVLSCYDADCADETVYGALVSAAKAWIFETNSGCGSSSAKISYAAELLDDYLSSSKEA